MRNGVREIIDGYAILAVNESGDRSYLVNRKSHDERLEQCVEWSDMQLEDTLIPDEVSDCLVMVFFKNVSVECGGWEHTEYDYYSDYVSHVILQSNYKEFWREQISYLITYDGNRNYPREFEEGEQEWINELIEPWELLYDDDFEIHNTYTNKENLNEVCKSEWE